MSIILKKSQHLVTLFKALNLQDSVRINNNIEETQHLLRVVSDKVRKLMSEQNVHIENLLAEKCMVLTRFYLSDETTQLEYFLDKEVLGAFFQSLPMAEATIFKQHLVYAQANFSLPDNALQDAMTSEGLLSDGKENNANVVDFEAERIQLHHLHKLQRLSEKADASKEADYESCFYELNAEKGTLLIHTEFAEGYLLYCELSPLIQIKAQQQMKAIAKASITSIAFAG